MTDIAEIIKEISHEFEKKGMTVTEMDGGYNVMPSSIKKGKFGRSFFVGTIGGNNGPEVCIYRDVVDSSMKPIEKFPPVADHMYNAATRTAVNVYRTIVGKEGPGLQILP